MYKKIQQQKDITLNKTLRYNSPNKMAVLFENLLWNFNTYKKQAIRFKHVYLVYIKTK